ncbi:AMP-binding protein [Pseudomonas oryzihabitans]|uniref:Acyl-CoA synthetase (AMP-forming)/AMP-acid ligase II/peptidoglycan/LPS O-acetylase OafA/YrhL n=1 Tax=Pseudomonas oryzihabitans TaxID=47885 RepID=A0AAJ2EU62_9PSED|nr:AMP-binding protein [Pseudomonas psychrotolerans]MDR6232423.1 acyl-CoA synthetase (AMP-forming)/AMP-acid ligase II/peptidoglycan/LPS O-acetylase OafA/YrhL [Pseudomonas psychrotolerans]MDR6353349.1 acyl-CoA synthetase (AMP-forming)/AMP-acid ligase II/peptidoglycan/LPS O-acetylase OafA/YrhL [Pseudomonas psychrotolerans]
MSMSIGDSVSRIRILALHGRGSNSDVTRMQLKNLGLSESDYDVVYANGPLSADMPGPGIEALEGLVSGPWYAWLPAEDDESASGDVLTTAVCDAVLSVLSILEEKGPFDGVFGFSQGGVIASLVNALLWDEALMSALQARTERSTWPSLQNGPPFRAVVIACAGAWVSLPELRLRAGLGPIPAMTPTSRIIHLIGRHDNYKPWSESLALALNTTDADVFYLAGGHEISQLQRYDTMVCDRIRECFVDAKSKCAQSFAASSDLDWKRSSDRSFRAIATDVQVSTVNVNIEDLPDTLVAMLAARPAHAPLLRLARARDAYACTTYGQMFEFCQPGGEGDLRRLGVQAGEVVAYLAPPGASAAGAVAFLSIASQTCAVPLGHTMSEPDALQALKQYGVKHIVLFEGVSAPGVKAACISYARSGSACVHYATQSGTGSPGLFRYLEPMEGFQNLPVLINPPTAYCLLLRTSGSTSIPKVVPLRQRDLVWNAAILADGIGINASDVTYSVMPLDHIGGLSASILCSIAVGASVTCEGLYNPQGMVEALMHSNPKPTWYSAVPTIHNATVRYLQDNSAIYLDCHGRWHEHGLRFIRSGAAALRAPDRLALEAVYGCQVVATYSMSEQMPICQPPRTGNTWQQKDESVGVPVIASMAVVDPLTFRPLPFGEVGEVAISGPTVFTGYLYNPIANQQSRFLLKSPEDGLLHTWFLTGDLGEIDPDGTLSLRGRLKELIKRGGEQISPFEVESLITQHPWVNTAVCFPVPSDLYGEEVGCALVLESGVTGQVTHESAFKEVRDFLREKGMAPYKFPTFLKLVTDDDLPKTASRKYIRNGLAEALGLSAVSPDVLSASAKTSRDKPTASGRLLDSPTVDWSTLAGFRFLLACYVMFMHIGSDQSWGAFANLRQFPWHVHAFFIVAGFSLTVLMPAVITRKASFVWARVSTMYPLYALALLFALLNLLPNCHPSTFSAAFHWNAQPGDIDRLFCEGTPLLQESWIANLFSTVVIYLMGLSATPLWGASWFMGFYLWFISMYFQCLVVFPVLYNALYRSRGNIKQLLLLTALGLSLNVLILLGFWYGYAEHATGYGFFDRLTGERMVPTAAQMEVADKDNAWMLGFYLFAPFWMVYFVAGMCAAFLFDAIRPSEQRRAYLWGYVADAITLVVITLSVLHVVQGYIPHGPTLTSASLDTFFLRPEAANNFADPGIVNRIWDEINSRLFAPITLLWVFALSTGQGLTAKFLRLNPISQSLAPTAYACFLFHQMVGQWYYAITRNGEWWNWWSYRKDFYWFSPQSVPVEWYEYFYVVGLVVMFGKLVQPLDQLIRRGFSFGLTSLKGIKVNAGASEDTLTVILQMVQRTTGMEAKPEWRLEDCGLASLGVVQFTNALCAEFSTATEKINLSVSDIISACDIHEIASLVDMARKEMRESMRQVLQAT